MSLALEGKTVIVTGGGGSIGRAASLLFAAQGGRVVVCDMNQDAAAETVDLVRRTNGEVTMSVGDVSVDADVAAVVALAVARYGGLDCAFNNAGITLPNDSEWDEVVFRRILEVNLVSQMLCMKHQIPWMLARGKGAIVNMSSVQGLVSQAEPTMHGYTASKHAVIGLTKATALQYARNNIRVNALCPGVTRSPMVEAAMAMSDGIRDKLMNYAPLRGIAEPSEIAEAALWLCSDKSSFVTGHALVADGGYTAQ